MVITQEQHRRNFLRRVIAAGAALVPTTLLADEPLPSGLANHQQRMQALRKALGQTHVLNTRLDSLENRADDFEQGLALAKAGQAKINQSIARIAGLNYQTTQVLTEAFAVIRETQEVSRRTGKVLTATNAEIAEVQCLLKDVNCKICLTRKNLAYIACLLKKVNCILCKLPANIRRAKVRAFIFGFLVGMGVGMAISGGSGSAKAMSQSKPTAAPPKIPTAKPPVPPVRPPLPPVRPPVIPKPPIFSVPIW